MVRKKITVALGIHTVYVSFKNKHELQTFFKQVRIERIFG